jgi:F0F1-type ATP synthase delta subunit
MGETLKLVIPIIAVHAAVLGVLIFVIRKIVMHDTVQAVNTVKQVEAEVRKKEASIVKQIEEHERDFSRKKAEAEDELQRQRQESEKEIKQMRDRMVGEAKKESQLIMDRARQNEEKFRQQISQEMEEKAVEYGGQIFRLVLSEKMGAEMNRHFVGELLDALQEVDPTSITVDAGQAEFKSSHPLDADIRQRLQKLLKEKFNADVEVREVVDAKLLGGLVFKLGSLEIDGSLVNRFQEAVGEVKKGAQT